MKVLKNLSRRERIYRVIVGAFLFLGIMFQFDYWFFLLLSAFLIMEGILGFGVIHHGLEQID